MKGWGTLRGVDILTPEARQPRLCEALLSFWIVFLGGGHVNEETIALAKMHYCDARRLGQREEGPSVGIWQDRESRLFNECEEHRIESTHHRHCLSHWLLAIKERVKC